MEAVPQQFNENEMMFGRELDRKTGKGTNTIVYVQKNKLDTDGLVPLSDETKEDKPVTIKGTDDELDDNLVPLKVFTVDAKKYGDACKNSGGVKKILEVTNNNRFMVAMPQEQFSKLDSIQMGQQSLTLEVTEDNGNKFVNGIKQVNDIKDNIDNSNSQTLQPGEDGTGDRNEEKYNANQEEYPTDLALNKYLTDNSVDNSTVILNNFSTLDEPTKKRVKNFIISDRERSDTEQGKIKKLLTRLSSNNRTNLSDNLIKIIEDNVGGKATRRRKRKGKKRSKNTRKKRKSKKQRRQ